MHPPHAMLTRVAGTVVDGLTVEPLSLASAKQYLRVEHDDEDDLIADFISAARFVCEQDTDRSLITTTWKLTLGDLPVRIGVFRSRYLYDARSGSIRLPMPPLIDLVSFGYRDVDGELVQLIDVAPGSPDVIVIPGTPGMIRPRSGVSFPVNSWPISVPIEITYTAGYGPDPADVPRNIVQAMRLLVAHYYEHRSSQAEIPDAVANLLAPSKWGGYA